MRGLKKLAVSHIPEKVVTAYYAYYLFAVCKGCIIYAKKSHLVCKIQNKTIVVLKLFLAHSIYKNHFKIVDIDICGFDSPDHFEKSRRSTQKYKYKISLCIYSNTYVSNSYIFLKTSLSNFSGQSDSLQ